MRRIKAIVRKTGLVWPKRQSTLATLIHFMAEYEAHRSVPGAQTRLRRLYLKMMGVTCPDEFWLGPNFFLGRKGNLLLGDRAAIGGSCRIMNFAQIEIGDDFLAGADLSITSASHDPVTLESIGQPVKIGQRVWTGTRVTILGNVTIGNDVVIGAGSVVIRDVPSNTIVAGVPAKVIRHLDRLPSQRLETVFPTDFFELYYKGL